VRARAESITSIRVSLHLSAEYLLEISPNGIATNSSSVVSPPILSGCSMLAEDNDRDVNLLVSGSTR